MPAPTLSTVLDRIGQTQAHLPAMVVELLGLVVLGLVVLPTWLVVRYVDTMAHEGAHALMGSSTGWKVRGVRLEPNGDGSTDVGSPGGLAFVAIGVVGYLGPSAFGLGAAKLISLGHIVAVLWLALLLLAVLLTTVSNNFGRCSVVITGLLLYLVARYAAIGAETVVAYLITWFLLLSGLRVVLVHRLGAKDAVILAGKTHIPRLLWVGAWLAGTVAALLVGGSLLV
jgi:hypothetical protein